LSIDALKDWELAQGFGFVGMTVAKTLGGGDGVVSILRRQIQ
jgi:hypothetical protein